MTNRLTAKDTVMKPEQARESMGGMVVPQEIYDHWWELTSKLLKAQAEITWDIAQQERSKEIGKRLEKREIAFCNECEMIYVEPDFIKNLKRGEVE